MALLAAVIHAGHGRADGPQIRLPADIVYQRVVGADSAVVFRHTTHVPLASNRCVACHPKLFRILTPTGQVAHREMSAGLACGGCHDGRQAFATQDVESCSLCHVGRTAAVPPVTGGRPGSFQGPAPIRYPPSRVSPGQVTFRHSTHMKGMECSACHPRPFAMKASSTDTSIAMHDPRACGGCHDGRRAFGVGDPAACSRCHDEKEGRR